MARPAEFDRVQALRDSMMVFWRRGYKATSIKELTDATRLQPGSLYSAFRSKHALFLLALDNYFVEQQAFVTRILRQSDQPPLQRIRNFFDELLQQSVTDKEKKGCLLVNTLLETPAKDHEINRRVTRMLLTVEDMFREVLTEAISDGSLSPAKNPAVLAKVLVNGIFGLRVYGKMHADSADMRRIVDGLLSILE